jgi:OST-HTH/LOTUS domain-containing protein
MPGSQTALGRKGACKSAPVHIAFRQRNSVGAQDDVDFAAQWLAYAIPYRRFADVLADHCARLGADVVCYSFIAVDFHHLLLTGLPAHSDFDPRTYGYRKLSDLVRKTGAFDIDQPEGRAMRIRAKPAKQPKTGAKKTTAASD